MWSDEWRAVREDVLTRDEYACRVCPRDHSDVGMSGLHAHHIRPRSEDGPDERGNLITLCEPCHQDKHNGRATYYDPEFVQPVRAYGPMSTGEVADWVGCSRTTARRRLKELASAGKVEKKGDAWRPSHGVIHRVLAFLNPLG